MKAAGTATVAPVLLARRPQRQADDGFRAALFAATIAELLSALPQDLRSLVLHQQLTAQTAGYAARYPDACYDIVEADGLPIGRIVTALADATLHVVDIALLPAWRGRGIGSTLLGALQDDARAAGLAIKLAVATANADALRLYKRLGFECIARSEVDAIMEWHPNRSLGQRSGPESTPPISHTPNRSGP